MASPFVRFLAPVEGHLIGRYGVPRTNIGPQIAALTLAEATGYKHEYDRAVADGSLRECSEADYLAQLAAQEAAAKAYLAKLEAERRVAAEAAAKAANQTTQPVNQPAGSKLAPSE